MSIFESPDLEVIPGLATEWKQIDETTWEFSLREGVKFHNGVTLTAEVAAESLGQEGIYYGGGGVTKDSFSAVDEQTLKIETTEPNPLLPEQMTSPNMELQYRGNKGSDGPIGTGPYKVEDITKTEPITVMEFDDYWGDAPALVELVFKGITDNQTRTLSLEKGEVDVAVNLPPNRFESLKELEEVTVRTKEVPETVIVFMNAYKQPTDDKNLRLALHWIVDQETIVESFLEGLGIPAKGPYARITPWSVDEELPSYGPDMERAQELIEESNYDGEELDLNVSAASSIHKQIAERIQQKASTIDININIRAVEPASHWDLFLQGKVNLWLANYGGDDGENTHSMFHSEGFLNRKMHKKNGTGTTNPGDDYDQLAEKGLSTFDKEERFEIWGKLQHMIMEAGVALPLYHRIAIFGTRADISGPDEIYAAKFKQRWETLSRK